MSKPTKYPLTGMYFKVSISGIDGWAVFAEVLGDGNGINEPVFGKKYSGTLPLSVPPPLGRHGCLSLKQGYVAGQEIKRWIDECVGGGNHFVMRREVIIELIEEEVCPLPQGVNDNALNLAWTLQNAWVVKYTGNSLKNGCGKCTVGSMEITYEELTCGRR